MTKGNAGLRTTLSDEAKSPSERESSDTQFESADQTKGLPGSPLAGRHRGADNTPEQREPTPVLAPVAGSVSVDCTFSPNQVLAGRYKIVRFIARGNMGEVYEAQDLELHQNLALKTVRPEIAGDHVAILTDVAINADETDAAKAAAAQEAAERRLRDRLGNEEAASVNAAIVHSLENLRVRRHKHR